MHELEVVLVPQLQDNYAYLLICKSTQKAAIVDCPEADKMIEVIESKGVTPVAILNTHHHWDHINGNRDLIARYSKIKVYGHHSDKERIPGMTYPLQEGDIVTFGEVSAKVFFTPGHTNGHISYYFEQTGDLFCGDVMFYGGCGRLFEGTAAQMHTSFQKLGALPHETRVYCGHEYTASNLRFAAKVDPDNAIIQQKLDEVATLRAENKPTIPSTIGVEWQVNPFLRVEQPAIKQSAANTGADSSDPAAVFGAIRELKNNS
ncbi:MAG TPA: hydroxyacylglutathione hydrolase [Myxococcales bacterium]|nr:hydroxyacylglutathione hydrolase [Deltaproteobacteria bacterium]MBU48055.1 hydroxyacylglutathione hydrolase [Deltaproteobacteria bacterium]HAA55661.1 hydroxyacylglutathione hydrolase [Myxococcales bacterium]|tara:strand:- start:14507 stop:15289 length:783 start_codon:yes stop_codon:yes gene_type:complete